LKVEQSVVRDKLNIPDPDAGVDLLSVPKTPPNAPPSAPLNAPPNAPQIAAQRALNRAGPAEGDDPIAPLADRLGQEAEPLMQGLLEPVRAAMNASGNLMEFRAALLKLYPELNGGEFATLMGQALAVADAAGYFSAGS
jgi:phage gp29-like protein